MLLSALVAIVAQSGREELLTAPGETSPRFKIMQRLDRLPSPKKSPKQKWEFEYTVGAYGTPSSAPDATLNLKFQIFSQMRKESDDPAPKAARFLLRLWDYAYRVLATDHSLAYNSGIVDLYLCFGGEPGGEQLFDEELENGFAKRVNTIYIYRITSFTDPVEMARELAHEYGHAILPPVGGFKQPEDWANGSLGELVFMRRMRDDLKAKRLTPQDTMGATLEGLEAYVAKHVDPLWKETARLGPRSSIMAGQGLTATNAYLGAALYAQTLLPAPVFARSLRLIGSWKAIDYPPAIVAAVAERPTVAMNVPPGFAGKPIWIPMPKGSKIVRGAKLQSRSGDWAVVIPSESQIVVQNPGD